MAPNPVKLPFLKAIKYFAQKLNVPSDDIQGEENDWAFAISGVTQAEMLADFRAAVDKYIQQGLAFNQFAKEFNQVAERYGWQPKQGVAWRANVVAATNMRMAYAAGQYRQRQNPAVKRLRPGLMWLHRDSPQFRPHHRAMDRQVFEAEQVNWNLPSGFGCRCRWVSVPKPESGYFELSDRLPYTLPDQTTTQIPAIRVEVKGQEQLLPIADPGFFYVPGESPQSNRPLLLQQMILRQPPALQRLIRKALPQRIVQKFLPRGFGNQ